MRPSIDTVLTRPTATARTPEPWLAVPERDAYRPAAQRRDRLWELSTNLHCSIIGTCLTNADLRALLAKLGDPAARTCSEHDLHGQAVGRASRKDEGGKLLHKLLDRRHEREIARFDRANTAVELRALWREALEEGRIPGAYWAVLTHPAANRALVQEVFGEIHMLSHLVGRSVRADLRRLAELEAEIQVQADTIGEQQARIQQLQAERVALKQDLAEALDRPLAGPVADADTRAELARKDAEIARLAGQVGRAEAHARAEAERRTGAERDLSALAEEIRQLRDEVEEIGAERDALEAALVSSLAEEAELDGLTLAGATYLYVGGRPRQVAQAWRFVRQRGGHLLTHDGGVEDNPTLLPGLVARSQAVLFPVDCISHDAAGTLKRACRDYDISFLALRSASLAALVTALAGRHQPAPGPACSCGCSS